MKLNIAICDDKNIICKEIKETILSIKADSQIDTFLSGIKLLEAQ